MPHENIPKHIAVIMDGNGRWAKQRFLPRIAGHRAGVEAARKLVKACRERGVSVLSLFAFSSENWARPKQEVSALMDIFLNGLEREILQLHHTQIKLRFIGDRTRFNQKLADKMKEAEALTHDNTGMVLLIAIDYGGQWDICEAMQKMAVNIIAGHLTPADITTDYLSSQLSFADLPDPDLFIRTSGEQRLSNFMLWQLAYTELYFTPVLWPDFNEAELDKALLAYKERERRYGHASEQLTDERAHA